MSQQDSVTSVAFMERSLRGKGMRAVTSRSHKRVRGRKMKKRKGRDREVPKRVREREANKMIPTEDCGRHGGME